MCLAHPARVEAVLEDNRARVDIGGIKKEISIDLVEGVAAGDYVLLHVGYALGKIDEAEAKRTLDILDEIGELAELREELIADVPVSDGETANPGGR